MSDYGLLDSLNLNPGDKPVDDFSEHDFDHEEKHHSLALKDFSEKQLRVIVASVAAVSMLLTALIFSFTGIGSGFKFNSGDNKISGQVALTQEQLIALVKSNNVTAFWAGPQDGALYALTITSDKQAYVKYLPDGKGLGDTSLNYRVIATYPESGAYDITRAAGTQANSVAFVNSDGGAVYYSKDKPTNVYLAYSGQPFEIEIFDPDAASSLSLASQSGAITQIK